MKFIVNIFGKTFNVNPIQVVEADSAKEALESVKDLEGVKENSKSIEHLPIIQSDIEVKDENFHIVTWEWAAIKEVLSVYAGSSEDAIQTAKDYMNNHKSFKKYSNYSNVRVHVAKNSGTYSKEFKVWSI